MKNRTRKGKSPIKIIMLSATTGLIITIILFAVIALIMTKIDIAVNKLPYYLIAVYASGAVLSAFLCGRKLQMRGIFAGIVSAAVYSLVILLLTFILSGYTFSFYLPIILAVDLIMGALAGIIAKNIR